DALPICNTRSHLVRQPHELAQRELVAARPDATAILRAVQRRPHVNAVAGSLNGGGEHTAHLQGTADRLHVTWLIPEARHGALAEHLQSLQLRQYRGQLVAQSDGEILLCAVVVGRQKGQHGDGLCNAWTRGKVPPYGCSSEQERSGS